MINKIKVYDLYYDVLDKVIAYSKTEEEAEGIVQNEIEFFGAQKSSFHLIESGEEPDLPTEYYSPSESYEYYDHSTDTFYNRNGTKLRHPSEYSPYTDSYTPFGDE
jgi:hypothetical protein